MLIFRNVYDTVSLTEKKFFRYIECELPAYFITGRYLTYDTYKNNVWFSNNKLRDPMKVSNNTSLQDLINGT